MADEKKLPNLIDQEGKDMSDPGYIFCFYCKHEILRKNKHGSMQLYCDVMDRFASSRQIRPCEAYEADETKLAERQKGNK